MNKIATMLVVAMMAGGGISLPAQAQGMGFGVFFGDEPADFSSDFFPERATCMTDRQIRERIADLGYSNIYLNVAHKKNIQVRATQGDWVYLLDFNFCSAQIEGIQQLRPAR